MSFSERMGFVPERKIQVESMDDRLRNRLFNYFKTICDYNMGIKHSMIRYTLDKMGGMVSDDASSNEKMIISIFIKTKEWYIPYDITEYILEYYSSSITPFDYESKKTYALLVKELNSILVEEKSGYRMADGKFVPITDENELKEIQDAMHSEFDSVDQHIKKALTLYSDRDKPDYENSIKESISAVEAMCCIITGMKGKNATLGEALKKLEENGVHIHGAMKSGFSSLYGYASDEDGIRHGGIDFVNAPEEDARYMLVSCSAFVNYLKDKYSKTQNGGQ